MKYSTLILALLLVVSSAMAAAQGTLVDKRDGKKYKTVQIGSQTWMAENLNYGMRDSYCYNDNSSNCSKYGRLYTWFAATSACPEGWHLPSEKEFEMLFKSAGGEPVAGKSLKSRVGWNNGGNGSDALVFSALPAGSRDYDGEYEHNGNKTYFWSSTENEKNFAYLMYLNYNTGNAYWSYDYGKGNAFSVRCIQDYDGLAGSAIDELKDVDEENSSAEILVDKRDGKKYKTVQIGSQTWMAENLNYETQDSYCYDDNSSNCSKYGRLYTWTAATSACPEGWHLPNRADFETLVQLVGGSQIAGKYLKAKRDWKDSEYGSDVFGFTALPAGGRGDYNGKFFGEGYNANFWSSTEKSNNTVYDLYLGGSFDILSLQSRDKRFGLSVRCIQDDDELAGTNSSVGTLVDSRDGKSYKTVQIGSQTWMAENLNYKTQDSYCYDDNSSNCSKYGRLYTWNAATSACPEGWHLPNNAEFETLFESVGGKQVAGVKLKAKSDWNSDGNGTDVFGFSAIPAGVRSYDGNYLEEGNFSHFWSSTKASSYDAFYIYLNYGMDNASRSFNDKLVGFSVRCLQDAGELGEPNSSAGTLVDTRDGKSYKTVQIGNQTWMAENLNYKTQDSYCYEDATNNCTKYGRLYTWVAASSACPSGWHLPSSDEWHALISAVGGLSDAGKKLKSKSDWNSEGNGTDAIGFSALPAGGRNGDGLYVGEGNFTNIWLSTEIDSDYAYFINLNYTHGDVNQDYHYKELAFSVRCIKD